MRFFAFGESSGWSSLEYCGIVKAQNKAEAKKMVAAYNRQWGTHDKVYDNFTQDEVEAEWNRRHAGERRA